MKIKISTLVMLLFVFSIVKAQDYSIKGKMNSDIYAHNATGVWNYTLNVSYGIGKQFDAGVYYTTHFYKEISLNKAGLDVRYYLTPFVFKKSQKFELYLKGSFGYIHQSNESKNYVINDYTYGAYLGLRYYPFKRIGIMTETGYARNLDFVTNFGLTFKLKK